MRKKTNKQNVRIKSKITLDRIHAHTSMAWQCRACTVINTASHAPVCEVCLSQRFPSESVIEAHYGHEVYDELDDCVLLPAKRRRLPRAAFPLLPASLMLQIGSYLRLQDIQPFSLVCKAFYSATKDDKFFKALSETHFNPPTLMTELREAISPTPTYKQVMVTVTVMMMMM